MTSTETVACPLCGERNLAIARRCGACAAPLRGGAPPPAQPTGAPASAPVIAYLAPGPPVPARDAAALRRHAVKAATSLLAVAAIYGVLATVIFYVHGFDPASASAGRIVEVAYGLGLLGALFLALAVWARLQPLPPSVVGVAVFLILFGIDVFDWVTAPRNMPRSGVVGSGPPWAMVLAVGVGVLVRILMFVLVVRALGHAMFHRQIARGH